MASKTVGSSEAEVTQHHGRRKRKPRHENSQSTQNSFWRTQELNKPSGGYKKHLLAKPSEVPKGEMSEVSGYRKFFRKLTRLETTSLFVESRGSKCPELPSQHLSWVGPSSRDDLSSFLHLCAQHMWKPGSIQHAYTQHTSTEAQVLGPFCPDVPTHVSISLSQGCRGRRLTADC